MIKKYFWILFFLYSTAQAESSFSIYVTNNTPYVIHLGKSFYNESDLKLITVEIKPYDQKIKVGESQTIFGHALITFYAQIGEDENYWNTPLVLYQLEPFIKHAEVEPQELKVQKNKYFASLCFNFDENPQSILLKIDPLGSTGCQIFNKQKFKT